MTHEEKLQQFADTLRDARRAAWTYPNLTPPDVRVVLGKKYAKIDVSNCGQWGAAYMVDADGRIWGCKGYGVVHKGHYYGTLDETAQWNWGGYYAGRKPSADLEVVDVLPANRPTGLFRQYETELYR